MSVWRHGTSAPRSVLGSAGMLHAASHSFDEYRNLRITAEGGATNPDGFMVPSGHVRPDLEHGLVIVCLGCVAETETDLTSSKSDQTFGVPVVYPCLSTSF
ncbi:hypothetical protein MN608_04730 [Microdochium nivale]|nr:hypothetical protein MN608_04730 [Microdochium nivale]